MGKHHYCLLLNSGVNKNKCYTCEIVVVGERMNMNTHEMVILCE